MQPTTAIRILLGNVGVVVSLNCRIENIALRKLHDGVQRLNRISVQIQQVVITTLPFVNPDQRVGPVEIANEPFQSFVPGVNRSHRSDSSVIKSHLRLEIRRNLAFFKKGDRMGVRPEPHPKNGITADLVAVEVGVDQA